LCKGKKEVIVGGRGRGEKRNENENEQVSWRIKELGEDGYEGDMRDCLRD